MIFGTENIKSLLISLLGLVLQGVILLKTHVLDSLAAQLSSYRHLAD
jgi:hypothetical protein